jgi:hypothetical protein
MNERERPTLTTLNAWPNCQTPDCENKASARLNSIYCHPCTGRLGGQDSAPVGYFDEFRRVQLETES